MFCIEDLIVLSLKIDRSYSSRIQKISQVTTKTWRSCWKRKKKAVPVYQNLKKIEETGEVMRQTEPTMSQHNPAQLRTADIYAYFYFSHLIQITPCWSFSTSTILTSCTQGLIGSFRLSLWQVKDRILKSWKEYFDDFLYQRFFWRKDGVNHN